MPDPKGHRVPPSSSPDYVREGEWVVVDLPLTILAMSALSEGLTRVWPDCVVLSDLPASHQGKLVIELRGEMVDPYGDEV